MDTLVLTAFLVFFISVAGYTAWKDHHKAQRLQALDKKDDEYRARYIQETDLCPGCHGSGRVMKGAPVSIVVRMAGGPVKPDPKIEETRRDTPPPDDKDLFPLMVYCSACGKVFGAEEEVTDDQCPRCGGTSCLSGRFRTHFPLGSTDAVEDYLAERAAKGKSHAQRP